MQKKRHMKPLKEKRINLEKINYLKNTIKPSIMKLTNQNGQDLNEVNSLSDLKTDRFDNEKIEEIINVEIPKLFYNVSTSLEDLELDEPEFLKEALKLFGKVEDENPVWSIALERKNWKQILAKVDSLKLARDNFNAQKKKQDVAMQFNREFPNLRVAPLNSKPKRKIKSKNLFESFKDQFIKKKEDLIIQFNRKKDRYRRSFYSWVLSRLNFWNKEINIRLLSKDLQDDARVLGSNSVLFKIKAKRRDKFSLSRMNQIKNYVDNPEKYRGKDLNYTTW